MSAPRLTVNGAPVDAGLIADCTHVGQARGLLGQHYGLDSPKIIHSRRSLCDEEPLPPKGKLLVIGAKADVVELLSAQGEQLQQRREDVAQKRALLRKPGSTHRKGRVRSRYGFNSFKVLPGFQDPEVARNLLKRLAEDRGIAGVMDKYKWSVPVLSEMYPEGRVGEDPVCVMGLNRNRGQEILLRLRTDDLKGFQRFEDVKKVLYHELTHNVHDDHNNEFKAFMSKLIKQGNALDWTRNGGRSTGEDMEYADVIGLGRFHRESDDDEAAFEGGVGKLGRAPDAEYWLREPEGSEPEGSEPEGSELEGSEPESLGERIRDPEPELPMQPKSLPTEDEATAQDLELMSGADTTCSLLAECEGIDLAHPDVQQLIQQEPFEDDPMDPMRDRQVCLQSQQPAHEHA
eukprot:TRINITY_DN2397_c0_g1_i4.p1 TRINITY_DN2397_c0_g1~~TRINITY_DN2397_c0_g1_i4.p1  ORF type:complete len:403 (-),score=63.04 TRINITY_DN2397_c0_g1_i4:579-1787(-)